MDYYQSPFSTRYSSKKMQSIFSEKTRAITFRKLWLSLAKAQKQLGLAISDAQLNEMEQKLSDIDFKTIHEIEKETRHDVMAHIKPLP